MTQNLLTSTCIYLLSFLVGFIQRTPESTGKLYLVSIAFMLLLQLLSDTTINNSISQLYVNSLSLRKLFMTMFMVIITDGAIVGGVVPAFLIISFFLGSLIVVSFK